MTFQSQSITTKIKSHLEFGNKVAITLLNDRSEEIQLTYHQLYQDISKMWHHLTLSGVTKGDKCMLAYEGNEIDYIISFLAINCCGATAVPFKTDFVEDGANNCKYIATLTNAKYIIASHSLAQLKEFFPQHHLISSNAYQNIIETISMQEAIQAKIAMIMFTSGSTGQPKGVPITKEAIQYCMEEFQINDQRTKDSTSLCNLPLDHIFGIVTFVFLSLWTGGHLVILNTTAFVFNPSLWLAYANKYQATHAGATNYMLSLITNAALKQENQEFDLSNMQSFLLGAEVIQPETVTSFQNATTKFGLKKESMTVVYGATETCSAITLTPYQEMISEKCIDGKSQLYAVGEALNKTKIKILDLNTEEQLNYGKIGEVCISGPSILENYFNIEQNDIFIEIEGERYFKTGDLGYLDQSNHIEQLYVSGRIKEIINIKGEKFSPQYIENIASQVIGDTGKLAAFSIPTKDSEELIVLVEETNILSDQIRQELSKKIKMKLLIRAKVIPQVIAFSKPDSFIKTKSGKIQRNKMKEAYIAQKWNATKF